MTSFSSIRDPNPNPNPNLDDLISRSIQTVPGSRTPSTMIPTTVREVGGGGGGTYVERSQGAGYPARMRAPMPSNHPSKEELEKQKLFNMFVLYLEFERVGELKGHISYNADLLLSSANFFLGLKCGQEFIIALYYKSKIFYRDEFDIKCQLTTKYQQYTNFIDIISNKDIMSLIHNYDDMTDEQIITSVFSYKLTFYSKCLSDAQLSRLIGIINNKISSDDYERELDVNLWAILSNSGETRFHILAADVLLDRHFYNCNLNDMGHDEFRKYILEHDRVSERELCWSLSNLSKEDLCLYDRRRIMSMLCIIVTDISENADYNIIEETINNLKPITVDDIQIIRDKKLCELVYVHIPEHMLLMCKCYQDEKPSQHYLRLVRMLPDIHDHKPILSPIPDPLTECYITLDIIHPCQLYRMCVNKHCVLHSHHLQTNKDICGVCRQDMLPQIFMNITNEQFDDIFV